MKRFIVAFISLILLSSCSSQFAYNNLDWLAYWYIDDYVDLNKAQKKEFDVHLVNWLAWHRKEELSKYQEQLNSLRDKIIDGSLTQSEVLEQFDIGREHWQRLRAKITPELSQFALLLNEQQIASLFAELDEQNDDWQEELSERNEADEVERKVSDLEDRIKEYIGKLTQEQLSLIKSIAPDFKNNSAHWLTYRRLVQKEAKKLFESRHESTTFIADLHKLMNNPESYRHPELLANSEHNRRLYAQLLSEVSATLTDKQKRRLLRKIDNLNDDLQDLIEDA